MDSKGKRTGAGAENGNGQEQGTGQEWDGIGKKKICAGSVYTLPALVTLSTKTPSCIHGDSNITALQRKIFITEQTSTISVTNTGRVY